MLQVSFVVWALVGIACDRIALTDFDGVAS
jgi:hypothetical protein